MYTKEEMVVLSLMYSKVKKERYVVSVFDHVILSMMFKSSIENNLSLFDRNNIDELSNLALNRYELKYSVNDYEKLAKDIRAFLSAFNYRKYIREAKEEIDNARRSGIRVISYFDDEYPEIFKNLEIPPFVLYIKGNLPDIFQQQKCFSILGSRNLENNMANTLARSLGKEMKKNGWYNISNMTPGASEYGHRGTIGKTGVILGQGLNTQVLPLNNNELLDRIVENGGFIISELPLDVKVNPVGLTARNRLQVSMTKGIVVVESSKNSNATRIAKLALENEKKVFVIEVDGVNSSENMNLFNDKIISIKAKEDFVENLKNIETNLYT